MCVHVVVGDAVGDRVGVRRHGDVGLAGDRDVGVEDAGGESLGLANVGEHLHAPPEVQSDASQPRQRSRTPSTLVHYQRYAV